MFKIKVTKVKLGSENKFYKTLFSITTSLSLEDY